MGNPNLVVGFLMLPDELRNDWPRALAAFDRTVSPGTNSPGTNPPKGFDKKEVVVNPDQTAEVVVTSFWQPDEKRYGLQILAHPLHPDVAVAREVERVLVAFGCTVDSPVSGGEV